LVDVVESSDAGSSEQSQTAETAIAQPTPFEPSHGTTGVLPASALRYAEVQRTRAFIGLTLLATFSMWGSLPLFSGDPTLESILAIVLPAGIVAGAGYYWWIRDPARYTTRSFTVLALSAVVNVQLSVLYFGIFSAGVMVVVIGLYFFSRLESRYAPWIVYGASSVAQAICAGAIISGAMRDPGFVAHPHLPVTEMVAAQVLVQILYLIAFWMGRSTRASTQEAIEGLERAMRVAARRGALLDEARAELDRALQIGDAGPFTGRVFGGYELGAVIGRGAMGDVYEASHTASGELAAVKLLPTSVLGDSRIIERFMREAKAASALASPHVVRVLAMSSPTDPLPYMVMERLLGHDLAAELRQNNRMALGDVVELVSEVGSVVDLARDKGIVHRDLKPQNIFFDKAHRERGTWKVLDFGVAALSDHSGTLTHGNVVGTPAYMSPEQARSEPVDHRADLHALAAVAYRCITGRPAFSGREVPAVLYEVVHAMPERPSAQGEIHPDVDCVLAIGLAKDREDRFASGRELAEALAAAGRGELSAELRERAAALIERYPWGERR